MLMVICAFIDPRNAALPSSMLPVAIFITILAEGICLGMQTGYALNPARDLGPRIMTAMVGYGKDGELDFSFPANASLTRDVRPVFTFRQYV